MGNHKQRFERTIVSRAALVALAGTAALAVSQAALAQKEFTALIEKSLKAAPAGSETAVAAVKSALNAATAAYDNASKIVKQAVEIAETNFANAATSAAGNVAAVAKAAPKRR